MRAVIYARFSTDQQSASSIDDQVTLCRSRAAALGIPITAVYSDAATSGQSLIEDRPGGRKLLADRFDVLIVEALDRLSRDQPEVERVVRRLEHRGARIVGVSDGYDTASGKGRAVLRLVRGMMAEQYVEDLREKTLRGMHGQFDRGYHLTGLSYGYRSVVVGVDARGMPVGHRLEVVPEQAGIVREVYDRYGAAGESCQRIVSDLNVRLVPGPRSGHWVVSAVYGSPAKGSGILNNELYVGRYVWNRSRWVKDPDTRRRQRVERPREEWRVEQRPELRIVTDEQWTAVRTRMDRTRAAGGRAGRGGMPTTLFGGILRCGLCGGAMIAVSKSTYGCATRVNSGEAICPGVTASRARTDETLLWHVRKTLQAPDMIARAEDAIVAIVAREARAGEHRGALAARVRELEGEVSRLVEAIAAVGTSAALSDRLRASEAALAAARSAYKAAGAPSSIERARRMIRPILDDLAGKLMGDVQSAREALRAALGEIVIRRDGDETFAEFQEIDGRILRAVVNGSGCGGVLPDPLIVRLRVSG